EEELARHARKLALAQFDLSTLEGFKGYQEFLAKEQRKGNARPAPRAKDADEPLFLDAGGLKEALAANEKFLKERYGRRTEESRRLRDGVGEEGQVLGALVPGKTEGRRRRPVSTGPDPAHVPHLD